MRISRNPYAGVLAAWLVISAVVAGTRPAAAEDAPGEGLAGAREALLTGDYEAAEKALKDLIEADAGKSSPEARATLARLYVETGRLHEAADLAVKLFEAFPKHAPTAVLVGEIALARGELKEAEDLFVKALELEPESRRARVFLKRIYDLTGRDKDAEKIEDYFWDLNNAKLVLAEKPDPRDYAYVAAAVKDFDASAKKVAFRHFMRAYKGAPAFYDAYLGAGELALEVYDWRRARREFKALLEKNARHPLAHLGLARVHIAASNNKEAEKEAKLALDVAPELAGAHLVLAQLHMVDDRMEEARKEIDAALKTNPADPEAIALDASWHLASGDGRRFEAVAKKAFALYPRHVGVYTGAAEVLERRRRFPEALDHYRKAKELAPDGWEGYYGEGMTLVRMGEERAAYAALEVAFERNPFNIWAYNTLVALDRDFKDGELEQRETKHWVAKITKGEEPVIGEQVLDVLERVWEEETKRFGFEPRGPDETKRKVLFEIFADHDDFSARTAGIPNLGALGATLGQVVTMPSPSWGVSEARAFRWTDVVRHEFVHVITLQLTDYRIPRWFTEGISVHVEGDPQCSWDPLIARAAGEGEIAPIEKLNSLFTRPEKPADVALGYYQASLVVDLIVKRHGFDAVLKACGLFKKGKTTGDVIRTVTGLAADEFDAAVKRHVEAHIRKTRAWSPPGAKEIERLKKRLEKEPSDAVARARLAEGLVAGRKYDEASAEAERAIRDAGGKGPAAAHVVVGLAAKVKDRDDAVALAAFERAVEADGEHFFARLYLGLAQLAGGDEKAAAQTLQ
ncbi:MAG: tetratricopeptide repeat protein, partial [Planctomycetota bacterium]